MVLGYYIPVYSLNKLINSECDVLFQLVIFADEMAMIGVELEGLLAYRADVKQLFLRDHLSWRAIKVSATNPRGFLGVSGLTFIILYIIIIIIIMYQ